LANSQAEKIQTTWRDVHVHESTKSALQNLTLSLLEPDEFETGVLARGNAPSVLLYGPPGTGKTLVVQAFAKESGARVLEVSPADIHHELVGKTEKIIRALFSLAEKLMPCVIFIDEVDGLFSKRQTGEKSWERTFKTQFLKEWGGLSRSKECRGGVLVVATNRPFDMDDASLRRLPRRILIDVPELEDRKEILKIHLRGEQLAEDVDLDHIARTTPLYTGSDLEKLCYEAATICVRERHLRKLDEGREAENGKTMRVIRQTHLERAALAIRPATAVETLKKIREFHRLHGDTSK
jgi:SpoVK/Ycf46/Vps4 family AAA+-type ATPase